MSQWEDISDDLCLEVCENYEAIKKLQQELVTLQECTALVDNFLYAENRIKCETCRLSWHADVEIYIGIIDKGTDSILPSLVDYTQCHHYSPCEITSAQACKRRIIIETSSSESEEEQNSQQRRKLEKLTRIRDLDFQTTSESSSSEESTDLWTCYGQKKKKKVCRPKTFEESNKEVFRYSKSEGFLPDPEKWAPNLSTYTC